MGPLSRDEEVTLARRALSGDAAAEERLMAKHLGLVKSLIKPMRDRGVDYDDLLQVGLLAMVLTIRRYDPERGTRLSTYATPRVRKALAREVAKARKRHLHLVDPLELISHPSVEDPDPDDSLTLDDVESACEVCLTDEEQAVVEMRYTGIRELSYREISLLTGRSKTSVFRTQRRAVSKLKDHLQPAA